MLFHTGSSSTKVRDQQTIFSELFVDREAVLRSYSSVLLHVGHRAILRSHLERRRSSLPKENVLATEPFYKLYQEIKLRSARCG